MRLKSLKNEKEAMNMKDSSLSIILYKKFN